MSVPHRQVLLIQVVQIIASRYQILGTRRVCALCLHIQLVIPDNRGNGHVQNDVNISYIRSEASNDTGHSHGCVYQKLDI